MKTFKNFLTESNNNETHTDLVKGFLLNNKQSSFYNKRDNCGVACIDLIRHAKEHGIKLKRVRGEFHGDKVVHDKEDFTKEMKKEMISKNLDFNNKEHRKQFITSSEKYNNEYKKIPHYWTVDENNKIHDPTGHSQIIKTGLSNDLNKERYHENI